MRPMPGCGSPSRDRLLDSQVNRSALNLVKVLSAEVRLPSGADAHEERTNRPDRARTWVLDRLTGG